MKHFILVLTICLAANSLFAQSDKYVKAMQEKIAVMDTTRNGAMLQELANAFERIAAAEKTQWLPYYYAALSNINRGYGLMQQNNMAGLDAIADKAEVLTAQAEALSPNNPEIFILKKMYLSLRMMVDPQNRFMQYGPLAQAALEQAKSLNPENPRVYLLEGQDKFYTPEQYGGSKAEAKKLFQLAAQKFDAFKPASAIAPAWGKGVNTYFLAQTNQ